MYGYYLLLFSVWLILATEHNCEKPKSLLNHNPLIMTEKLGNYNYPKKARITLKQTQEYYYLFKHDAGCYCPFGEKDKDSEIMRHIKYYKITKYEYCLFKKVFLPGEKMCENEVKPVLVEKRNHFGQIICGDNAGMYQFGYEICAEYSLKNRYIRRKRHRSRPKHNLFADVVHSPLYEICFKHSKDGKTAGEVLFTEHKIRSPQILRNLNLDEERAMHDFSERFSTESYGYEKLKNLRKILEAYEGEKKINRNRYVPQMLVPMYDFALGHWMRTTLHIMNYSPQDVSLEPLWRAVNTHVYNRLIKLYEELGDVRIFTGTYGVLTNTNREAYYVGDDKDAGATVPRIWWKLLYASKVKKAVVIIMHNVAQLKKICYEEEYVCDVSKWELSKQLKTWHYDFLYCCKMSSVKDEIKTMQHLGVDILEDMLKLDDYTD